MTGSHPPSIGVEEEYFLVDPSTRDIVPVGARVVERAAAVVGGLVAGEFATHQVEGRTPPCTGLAELHDEIARVRAALVAAAREEGVRLCASGTPVVEGHGPARPGEHPRYQAGLAQYRAMLEDLSVSALHVHVHLPDRELAVLTGNHLRPWLPLLVALAANSPFHRGRDTGYASWRSVIRGRFPCLGPPPYAASLEDHRRLAVAVAETEAMLEPNMPFWDLRPHPRLPTLEVRCMDVSPAIEDTVALAGLVRALVVLFAERAAQGDPGPRADAEVLRAACWRAARDGWTGRGADPRSGRMLPVAEQARRSVGWARPLLEGYGDLPRVSAFLRRLADSGGGAQRQRSWARAGGGLADVVDRLVEATERGGPGTP
ncbi:YbdK family carboxylate-amine ligase [Streptomyces mobaraensis]|uniref:carboxylate-amine ligase n=1 Tax=Streptomyces mobaraensis TaxID=35621 RepID=UPI003333BC3E